MVTAVGKPVRIKQPDVKRVSPAEVAAALGAEPWLPPGSDEALAAGCKCPVLDNARGRGYMGCPGAWVKLATCPLHGQDVSGTPPEDDKTAPAPPDEKERIQAALLDTPETTHIEYVSSRAAASMERFLLTSEELAGIHQDAAPKDDPMRNYYKGRKVAFREALNIFLHLIK